MSEVYPDSPRDVPPELTAPTSRYKRQVAAAVLGVIAFFLFYFALTGWIGHAAYRAFRSFPGNPGRAIVIGVPATVLFLVLIKGLFAGKKVNRDLLIEVTPDDEPKLFAFVHRIAEETGAPKPYKVFLSPEVNAAVAHDVGLINLIVPTRKNLIIGLGLVNALSLDEFKAVIAHEFGHFAQRSTAVGQWVHIARMFVADLIVRRDVIDRFFINISYWDFRIAWIGWAMRLLTWSIRAVVEQFFDFLLLLSRALSRQMEFQADLVSVSVAGSDSLVHALHRLGAADAAFGRAGDHVIRGASRGRLNEDMFSLQSRYMQCYREVHALPEHGLTPARPEVGAEDSRVFKRGIAEPPQMWSTHPSNNDREENCKARYVPSVLDHRGAWEVFQDPPSARRTMTSHFVQILRPRQQNSEEVVRPPEGDRPIPVSEGLDDIDKAHQKPSLNRRYQGLYTTAEMTRVLGIDAPLVREPEDSPDAATLIQRFDALFEPHLAEKVEAFFALDEEVASLEGLRRGYLKSKEKVLYHRGKELSLKEVAEAAEQVREEFEAHRRSLAERFADVHGIGLRIARGVDGMREPAETSWANYVEGLLQLVRYAEHSRAALGDAVSYFFHVLDIVFADRNVSSSEMARLEEDGGRIAQIMRRIFNERRTVVLPESLSREFNKEKLPTWEDLIGKELHLAPPRGQDFSNDWINIAESWWNPYLGCLGDLRALALDELIKVEEELIACLREGRDPGPAPKPGLAPLPIDGSYNQRLKRQEKLGLWDRFQTADGPVAAGARLLVACALLAPAFVAADAAVETDLVLYNGLAVPVVVNIDGTPHTVGPEQRGVVTLEVEDARVRTTTGQGELVEEFVLEDLDTMDSPIYNIADAAGFERWGAAYGSSVEPAPEYRHGRYFDADVDHLFSEPPASVTLSRRSSGTVRTVLSTLQPEQIANFNEAEIQRIGEIQLRFSPQNSPAHLRWQALMNGEASPAGAGQAPSEVK